jgi:quercetin dioxygenase-like cupin family protein
MTIIQRVLFAAAASGLAALAAFAADPTMDPAVVNAKTAHVNFENDRVRVIEAVLQPDDKEKMHSHPAYVIYVLSGGKVRNHSADGKTTESEFVTGQTIFREPITHWAENVGTTTIHVLLVELKASH